MGLELGLIVGNDVASGVIGLEVGDEVVSVEIGLLLLVGDEVVSLEIGEGVIGGMVFGDIVGLLVPPPSLTIVGLFVPPSPALTGDAVGRLTGSMNVGGIVSTT